MEQFLSAKYLSGRNANQKIGVVGSTEDQKVLEVIGNVGIGTTIFEPTEKLDVRGSVSVADTITATTINATTVVITGTGNTFADLNVTGLSTFGGNIDANAGLDVDGLSDLDELNVAGIATFGSNLDVNASVDVSTNLTVDGLSDLDELNVAGIATFGSNLEVNASVDVSTSLTVGSATTITGAGIVAGIVTGTLDNDLTLATSGTGLSGSATYNNSSAATFTVTSNATDANTAGTIVARDGSGNFSAGTITANLTGNVTGTATTATNLADGANITTGTISDDRLPDLITSNINIASGISSVATLDATNATIDNLTFTSGTAITSVDTDLSSVSASDDTLASAKAIKDYVDGEVSTINTTIGNIDLDFAGDTGTGAIDLDSETFTIAGTTNEIETVGAGNTLTIGLPNVVAITTSLTVGAATTITGDGIVAGIVTGTLDNDLTLATSGTGLSGSATYNNSGASTFTVTSNATDANTASTIVARDGSGNFSAGTITADLTGVASTATALETARDFSITGSFVTAPAISFDGTANVALAATITADSITLGTYTSGDYVESITGTTNEIEVTGGTGEGSTPQIGLPNDVTITQDLQVNRDVQINRNLNVDGNITIGGTSATLFTTTLEVADADLILGVRTDGLGNDIATDSTANHGGIAIASTEGNPLVDLYVAGIETVPSTYKKIMWFKAGTFSGLGTDAWLSNYAVGIGSTQFPTGTRFAAGNVQVTENDISVVRNINASGIITGTLDNTLTLGTSGTGLSGSATYDNSGAATFTVTSNATDANTASTIVARDGSGNFSAGTITANLSGNVTGNLTGTATTATKLETARDFSVSGDVATASAVSFNGTGNVDLAVTLSNSFDANTSGIITASSFVGDLTGNVTGNVTGNLTGTATTATNLADAANITTGTIDDARLPATITSDITGNAATATTATNLANAANITTGTISDDRLPDIITSNINVTSGVSTISQIVVGSAVTINSSGINTPTGIVTALQFVGTASTASFATTAFTLNGTAEGELSVGSAVTATNIAGGDTGDIPYQSAANTTTFVDASSAGSGQVLLWNGSAPEWGNVSSASGAFGGVTIKDEGSTVGTAGSVSTLNFVGSNIVATATTGANGVSTITMSDTPTFDELTVTGLSSLTDFTVSGISTFSNNVLVGSGITMYASTGIISATAFYGSGQNLTDLINQRIEGLQIQEEGSDVGVGFTFSILNFVGPGVTATAGIGSTATITIPGDISVDTTPQLGGDLDLNSNDITGTGNVNITGIITATSFVGSLTGTATTATNITLADESSDTTCFPIFATDATGNQAPKTDSSALTYNASTGTLSATAFSGDGSGLTGVSAGTTPTENTTNQAQFIPFFVSTASTDVAGISSATLVFNPSTNRMGVGTDSPQATLHVVDEFLVSTAGAASTQRITQRAYTTDNGTLSWEGSAGQLFSITNNLTSGSIFSVNDVSGIPSIDVDADGTIQLAPYGSTEFVGIGTTNPTSKLHVIGDARVSGAVTATSFTGDGSGLTNLPVGAATSITLADESSDTTCFPIFATDATGNQAPKTDSSALTYNASTGSLSATSFVGSLTGTATTATNIDISAVSSGDTTAYVVLVGNNVTGGQQPFIDNGSLTYNASTNVLTAGGGFSGDGSALTSLNGSQITSGTIPGDRGVTSGSTSSSFIEYNGTTSTAGQFDGGTTNPSSTTRLNYDGYFYATRLYSDSAIVGSAVTIDSSGIVVTGIVTATDFNSTSDARLKTNVQVIEDPLEKVQQINGVSFNWIKDNKPSMGVIADNIQEVLPELVSDTDPKTVNYNGLIGLLIECVKQQQEEINTLKAKINNNNWEN